jgi:hypothetical protein
MSNSHKLAVVIPYRDRLQHLMSFLPSTTTYLRNANIDHEFYIVEQENGKPFNRGKLLNIGFLLAEPTCDYVVFHDVDMIPIEADYSWTDTPIHMATECSQFDYKLPYETYFGGVTMFNCQDFRKTNGYHNEYWGWGAEDDDLRARCEVAGLQCNRRRGRYMSLQHKRVIKQEEYAKNIEELREFSEQKMKINGLSNMTYSLIETQQLINQSGRKYKVSI